jgi:tRNA(Ile2)-agmatinylcytidine synthase
LKSTVLNIGFDDTDSPKGMCTTYLAYKIVDLLRKERVEFLDFPYLIRFNPNIPWKTRGNGAVGLKIRTKKPEKIKKRITSLIERFSDIKNGANPGLIFYEDEHIPESFKEFSKLALWKLINRKNAKKFVSQKNLESFYLGNGQGLVGAIGAIGYEFDDHTLELLSYRKKSNFGKKRKITKDSVRVMQEKTFPHTFNSFDTKKEKVMISPRGPDPVFYGIRGENPDSLFFASTIINSGEKPDGYMLFKSNQGTSDHLRNEINVVDMKPFTSGTITGIISQEPKLELGGHVMFSIVSKEIEVRCAVYKQTGMSITVMNLIKGDKIRIGGGIRKASSNHPRTINVEFFQVLKLERNFVMVNPTCNKCNKKMKSKGRNQGFECVKCGRKSPKKLIHEIPRKVKKKLYVPEISAHRHLTRPLQREGLTNKETRFDDSIPWFKVFEN